MSRLHLNKLIPTFNIFYDNPEEAIQHYDKIMEGTIIFCEDVNYLLEKFKFIKDFSKVNKNITGKTNNLYTVSVDTTDLTYSASSTNLTKEEQQINLTDAMKYFLGDIELFLLFGYKIAYKVTPLATAEFDAELI